MADKPKEDEKLTPREEELKKQLDAVTARLTEEAALRKKVLEDTAIVEVLKARNDGREISVVDKVVEKKTTFKENITTASEKSSTSDDVNRLSNSELLDVIVPAVEELVSSAVDSAKVTATEEFAQRFGQLEVGQDKLKNALIKQAAAAGVLTMRNTHEDFDTFSNKTVEVMSKTGLTMEDAYLLAKAREGATVPDRVQTETERPNQPPYGRHRIEKPQSRSEVPERKACSSTASFRELVGKSLDRTMQNR